jgi:pyruvate dehydrogenase E2 component (dihydrolipoamide acetyltransferase)
VAQKIIMPKTGMAMEEGTVVHWLKKVGDTITRGEAIAVIETDKVTMELESDDEGTLLAIIHGDGEVVKATHAIAWIGAPGETVPAAEDPPAPVPMAVENKAVPASAAAPAAAPAAASFAAAAGSARPAATPAARAAAAEAGIDLRNVAGSGPGGAVRLRDLETAPRSAPVSRLAGTRRVIADKMLRSHQEVPAVTLFTRADVTELVDLRARINAGGGAKISYTDFIVRAAATALRDHPLINSVVEGDRIVHRQEINIGIAVAREAGLIVPVLRNADGLGIRQIAAAVHGMAEGARAGTLTAEECSGGTFTITNLGMYGITEFTPLINIPESAILGVGTIEEAFRTGPSGIESRKLMSLCLTHDHRHIDGAPAAAFLSRIRALLEDCIVLVC